MPNHVTHRTIVTGPEAEIARFRATCFNDEEGFDFNTLIPMPTILRDAEEGSNSEFGAKLIMARAENNSIRSMEDYGFYESWVDRWRSEHNIQPGTPAGKFAAIVLEKEPQFLEAGMKRLQAIQETGYASWYPWSIANWGTKWGAYSVSTLETNENGGLEFRFDTAWSPPTPIFEKLAEVFPELTFDIAFYDEGSNFAGHIKFTGEELEDIAGSDEATDELYELVYGEPPEKWED